MGTKMAGVDGEVRLFSEVVISLARVVFPVCFDTEK